MNMVPSFEEEKISQIPAIQLLVNMGFVYLTPSEALELRGGRKGNVILEEVLKEQLVRMNRINFKGKEYPFSEGNIFQAIQSLKDILPDGVVRTNEKIYDLLSLGTSLKQTINGDIKSFTLQYIDWKHPENNVWHVTDEFSVERSGSKESFRPDIVIFVNGIPLAVIECKRPDAGKGRDPIELGIEQMIRNQKEDGIPRLFYYTQLLLVISKNDAKYGTTGTAKKFWALWKENGVDSEVKTLINKPLSEETEKKLYSEKNSDLSEYFRKLSEEGEREVTGQDRAIYCLCRPERLLELSLRFTLFDKQEKKIARYQQYFCVKKTMRKILSFNNEGKRNGGVIWHTQGSGKSLTMVMLAKSIALEPSIRNHKIILVTDRVELDNQISDTFKSCKEDVVKAKTGRDLADLLKGNRERIITTVIDKFEAAVSAKELCNDDSNIFVLVDESHRSQYGPRHAKMRKSLPKACYIGFTGTPVMKKDKNTIEKFGGLIDSYTIKQAVDDKAVVPLLYEGRHVAQTVDSESIDDWFDKITRSLSKEQAEDLKRKFSSADQLNKAEKKVMRIAWDISEHYKNNWQGTGLKGQLVAQDKVTALKYKKYLDEFGMVSSELLFSSPDVREGEEDVYSESNDEVLKFWKTVIDKYGNEKEYNKQIIAAFKSDEAPEIIIVVDKLLTGFDAPVNTILYLTRKLKDHTLLQAIARVNRLHDNKEYGFIVDYRGVLSELDQALDLYGSLSEFDRKDLENTLTDISEIINKLPQKHSDLLDIFKSIKNKKDEESFEILLADDVLRLQFYERLTEFAKTLNIALSSDKFLKEEAPGSIDVYKDNLKFYMNLRKSVRRRYAEAIDYSEYEPKIQKLIDSHVGAKEVENITPLVNIFDTEKFQEEVDKLASDAARADTIAHRTKKTIEEKMAEDPVFYRKFSELLQETIQAFREARIKDAEYLAKVKAIMKSVIDHSEEDIPDTLKSKPETHPFFRQIRQIMEKIGLPEQKNEEASIEAALQFVEIINNKCIVNWQSNIDIKNKMKNEMDEFLHEIKNKFDFDLTFDDIDLIIETCLSIAGKRPE